jgi:hypothetical protein
MSRDGRGGEEGRVTVYKGMATLLALTTLVLGLAMLAFTLAHGGGVGILLGLAFVGVGGGRLYLLRRKR